MKAHQITVKDADGKTHHRFCTAKSDILKTRTALETKHKVPKATATVKEVDIDTTKAGLIPFLNGLDD